MHTIGTREFKDRLTHYLLLVRQGTTLLITDRGKPVAIVRSPSGEEGKGLEGTLAGLAAEGSISLPRGKGFLKKPPAIRGRGTPPSHIILEGRR
jgi:prevent-host-death family protein